MELKKHTPVNLRSVGKDEKWLQAQILADPSLLGLGALNVAGKEHMQPSGGRIDFLMRSDLDIADEPVYYEVEVMLGALDESHIIRTIEYWDLERTRRPKYEHRAVIVAEKITSRFFNVLRLLNRSVPLIAIQLSAFVIGDDLVLLPVKVLDVIEEVAEDDESRAQPANRDYWVERSNPAALEIADKVISMVQKDGIKPRVTYNRDHIALGTTGYNFCWLRPARSIGQCTFDIRCSGSERDAAVAALDGAGISTTPSGDAYLRFRMAASDFGQFTGDMAKVLDTVEKASRPS